MRKTRNNERLARQLRRELSLPERLLWQQLKGKKAGLKFRRQHPVGPYVLDFYCAAAKTGFEIDGATHGMGDNPQRDARRESWIVSRGINVVRIAASEVLADPVAVAEAMTQIASERS